MNQVIGLFNFIPSGDTLSKILLYFFGASIFTLIISPLIINLLYKANIRRAPKGDKVTDIDVKEGKIGTPIMGGIIVIISVVLITYLFNWERNFTWLPIGVFIMSGLVGGIDDLLNLFGQKRMHPKPLKLQLKLIKVHKSRSKRVKMLAMLPWNILRRSFMLIGSRPNAGLMVHEKILLQTIIGLTVGIWVYSKLGWTNIWLPFLDRSSILRDIFNFIPGIDVIQATSSIDVGILIIPFIILTIITITNAVNLTDGMDGLSSGLLLISFTSYLVISYSFSQVVGNEDYRFIAYLCATVCGSLISYLYFNIKPARVQLGDVGSLSLGTLLAVVTIVTHREFTLLFTSIVFIVNGVLAPLIQKFTKKFFGKPMFRLTPLHYHFKLKGWSEEKVVMRFWILGVIFTVLGVWLAGL